MEGHRKSVVVPESAEAFKFPGKRVVKRGTTQRIPLVRACAAGRFAEGYRGF
jgi:hypothetical protein